MISSDPTSTSQASDARSRAKWTLAILLLLAAGYAWWLNVAPYVIARTRSFPPVPRSAVFSLHNEQSWVVAQIAEQISETLAFSAGKLQPGRRIVIESGASLSRQNELRFRVAFAGRNMPSAELEFASENYLWSPDNFTPWVRKFAEASQINLSNKAPHVDGEYLLRLTDPRPQVLMQEDRRISDALTKNPLSAKYHEEAAMLIGSLALREASWNFLDARPAMNAISAHLAIAKVSAGELSACGELAEALLCSLSGRQAAAVELINGLKARVGKTNEIPLEAAMRWARAIKMHNTGDYRSLDQPEHASLLERLEYFRALRDSVSSEAANAFAETTSLERLAEWPARILAGRNSVEAANAWTQPALEAELEECSATYRIYHGEQLQPTALADALNEQWQPFTRSAGGNPELRVLGWGAWAQFYQRQICELAQDTHDWLDDLLGLPEDAQKADQALTETLKDVELFPLVFFKKSADARGEELISDKLGSLVREHPEKLTFQRYHQLFQALMQKQTKPSCFQALVDRNMWFYPRIPAGTAYDVRTRGAENDLLSLPDDELTKLKGIAPYDVSVLWSDLQKTANFRPTAEQTIDQFKELSGYNANAMRMTAESLRNDPERYKTVFESLCRIDPNRYLQLGDYLVEHHDEAGAARAYQAAFDHAPDRVYVSNNSDWLINYYYDHGRKDDAFKIAKEAAAVYSHGGLAAMGRLLERTGDLDKAEEYFRKIDARYKNAHEAVHFYLRNQAKQPRYKDEAKRGASEIFPEGLETISLASLTDAPSDGVQITGPSSAMTELGLRIGDVLVAIDSQRLRNKEQYYFLRDISADPSISYFVWRNDTYAEIKGILPERKLGALIADYHPLPSGPKPAERRRKRAQQR